jgi:hypothetical protein
MPTPRAPPNFAHTAAASARMIDTFMFPASAIAFNLVDFTIDPNIKSPGKLSELLKR